MSRGKLVHAISSDTFPSGLVWWMLNLESNSLKNTANLLCSCIKSHWDDTRHLQSRFSLANCGQSQFYLGWNYSVNRYTLLEGMSQGEWCHLCQGDMTRHPSPNHSFSDSWRSEMFNISSQTTTSSVVFSNQQSHFLLFIRILLSNQPAG